MKKSLFSPKHFLVSFVLVAFTITCCMLLFLRHTEFNPDSIRRGAALTFVNVVFLSLLYSTLDAVRRKFMVERPVKRILSATQRICAGDFSARIKPFHGYESTNELDIIIADFNKMAAELENIEALRTDFAANVSHELKTPLSVIGSYASMLQAPALSTEQRIEYAEAISSATNRLSALISNILKLNKLENQQIFPETHEYNLGEQICECLLGFEEEWERKGLEICADIDDDIIIRADGELLSIVWNNLFQNAVKFTEHGKISVNLKRSDGFAVVKVSDTGCGISPEVGAHIFEKFYQGDKSRRTQGNGLGLALVRRVIDIAGAEIHVESVPGKGSTFCVRLKLQESNYGKQQ